MPSSNYFIHNKNFYFKCCGTKIIEPINEKKRVVFNLDAFSFLQHPSQCRFEYPTPPMSKQMITGPTRDIINEGHHKHFTLASSDPTWL